MFGEHKKAVEYIKGIIAKHGTGDYDKITFKIKKNEFYEYDVKSGAVEKMPTKDVIEACEMVISMLPNAEGMKNFIYKAKKGAMIRGKLIQ